jgi:PAS domain S-box-containing protein
MKTDLKRTQTEHLLENMSDGYFLLDQNWCFSDVNEHGRNILAPATELIGKNIWDVFPDSLGTDYQKNYELAVQTQKPVHFEIFSPRLRKWFEIRAIPLGKDGLSVFFNDITSRKQQQETLQRALLEAKSANELKSAFLANMSHEIRTPLGAILGFAEILADPNTKPEDRQQFVSIIERNGRLLSRLIDDILDLSKVESGLLELEIIPFSLRRTLETLQSNIQMVAQNKALSVELEIDEQMPDELIGDPTRLSQILMNLLQNAIKFTDRGQIQWKISSQANVIFFDIIDTGIGMTPEQASKLFVPFRQADESITRRYGGTGLGLALSRKLAQLLGGDIQLVESEVNKGSRFQVHIPLTYKKPQLEAGVF